MLAARAADFGAGGSFSMPPGPESGVDREARARGRAPARGGRAGPAEAMFKLGEKAELGEGLPADAADPRAGGATPRSSATRARSSASARASPRARACRSPTRAPPVADARGAAGAGRRREPPRLDVQARRRRPARHARGRALPHARGARRERDRAVQERDAARARRRRAGRPVRSVPPNPRGGRAGPPDRAVQPRAAPPSRPRRRALRRRRVRARHAAADSRGRGADVDGQRRAEMAAMSNAGYLLANGEGAERDDEAAGARAPRGGRAWARGRAAASRCSTTRADERPPRRARRSRGRYLRMSANQGDADALCALGDVHEAGSGDVLASDEEAAHYFRQAAAAGLPSAQLPARAPVRGRPRRRARRQGRAPPLRAPRAPSTPTRSRSSKDGTSAPAGHEADAVPACQGGAWRRLQRGGFTAVARSARRRARTPAGCSNWRDHVLSRFRGRDTSTCSVPKSPRAALSGTWARQEPV